MEKSIDIIQNDPDGRFECRFEDDRGIIAIMGQAHIYNAPVMKQMARELIDIEAVRRIVIDFEQCTFIDSTGLGVLISTHKRTVGQGTKEMSLRNLQNSNIRKVFEVIGLDRVFVIEEEDEIHGEPSEKMMTLWGKYKNRRMHL